MVLKYVSVAESTLIFFFFFAPEVIVNLLFLGGVLKNILRCQDFLFYRLCDSLIHQVWLLD